MRVLLAVMCVLRSGCTLALISESRQTLGFSFHGRAGSEMLDTAERLGDE
jgi:hypothetical protein